MDGDLDPLVDNGTSADAILVHYYATVLSRRATKREDDQYAIEKAGRFHLSANLPQHRVQCLLDTFQFGGRQRTQRLSDARLGDGTELVHARRGWQSQASPFPIGEQHVRVGAGRVAGDRNNEQVSIAKILSYQHGPTFAALSI